MEATDFIHRRTKATTPLFTRREPVPGATSYIAIESGQIIVRSTQDLTDGRAAGPSNLDDQRFELVPANTDATLTAGDALFRDPYVRVDIRSLGSTPAVLRAAQIN